MEAAPGGREGGGREAGGRREGARRELRRAQERATAHPGVVVQRRERRLHCRVELVHVLPLHRVCTIVAQLRVVRRAAVAPAVTTLPVAAPLRRPTRSTAPLVACTALVPARKPQVARCPDHPMVLGRPQARPLPHAVRRLVLVADAVAALVVAGGIKGVREAILRTSALTDDLSPDHWTQHRLNLTE